MNALVIYRINVTKDKKEFLLLKIFYNMLDTDETSAVKLALICFHEYEIEASAEEKGRLRQLTFQKRRPQNLKVRKIEIVVFEGSFLMMLNVSGFRGTRHHGLQKWRTKFCKILA